MRDKEFPVLKTCGPQPWKSGFFNKRGEKLNTGGEPTAESTEKGGVVHIVNL
jgi:hypothetical protein